MKRAFGFTLLELMIVVAIMAILATIAYGAYNKQLRKSRRADAKQVLGDYSLRQEKWRLNHTTYGSLSDINGASPSAGGFYDVTITFPSSGTCASGATKSSANSFIITATAKDDQTNDTGCTTLVLTSDCGLAPSKTPPNCWQ